MNAKPCILYVEDEPASRTVMTILVRQMMGLDNLFVFEDSTDIVAHIESLEPQPDLILLDIHLTPLDGFEVLTLLRAHPSYQARPIVALTASVMNEEVQQLRDAGFDGVIAKPIKVDTFPTLIARILSGEHVWTITG